MWCVTEMTSVSQGKTMIITIRHLWKFYSDSRTTAYVATRTMVQNSIIYLGHILDKDSLHPTESKVKAVKEALTPRNVGEHGLINYYQKFLLNLSSILHPLHRLITKGATWEWSKLCEDAFNKMKALLSTDRVLVPYKSKLPFSLACDASAYGPGAVLLHVMPNGEERPVAFASRALSESERNYA